MVSCMMIVTGLHGHRSSRLSLLEFSCSPLHCPVRSSILPEGCHHVIIVIRLKDKGSRSLELGVPFLCCFLVLPGFYLTFVLWICFAPFGHPGFDPCLPCDCELDFDKIIFSEPRCRSRLHLGPNPCSSCFRHSCDRHGLLNIDKA